MPKSVFTDAYKTFLDVLIQARKDAGVTQAELAERLGKPQPWVSNIERGIRRVDVIEFIAICHVLRVQPDATISTISDRLSPPISI
ncbi:MAG: helix-turn-helix transcriptional regulator [Alphaproteobacteria bacterium]|uniref:helix-turn-helix domain-containing protein n=1 Tax=Maricaulis alexandrii TaxID=2570354 RepID=UPI0014873E0D|nr:helix-turn-helix transcriptional regulator [Alphaproteobacteria bacterium]